MPAVIQWGFGSRSNLPKPALQSHGARGRMLLGVTGVYEWSVLGLRAEARGQRKQ